jgi:hypothetical protein
MSDGVSSNCPKRHADHANLSPESATTKAIGYATPWNPIFNWQPT